MSALLVAAGVAPAQAPHEAAAIAERFASMTAVTGYEEGMVDTVLSLVPGAARDRAGNAVRPGRTDPRRLAACALDEPGWVVGRIRHDGWLTLRRTPGTRDPARDQQLEGARVTVFGRTRPIPGVVAVRSIHLTRQRDGTRAGRFTADSALVDLGAASAGEVSRLGVGVLSPVALAKRPHRYGEGLLAAPSAGRRAACAALVAAAERLAAMGVAVAFAAQHELGERGLAAVARLSGPYRETLLVDAAPGEAGRLARTDEAPGARIAELGRVTRLAVPVRYPGSPVETVALEDVRRMAEEIVAWARAR